MKRRDFIATASAAAALPLLPRLPLVQQGQRATPAPLLAKPFDLSRVRLLAGPCKDAMEVNRKFLLAQDPDRLLHTFRITAGLPTTAEPLGGWEAPVNELRGHYTGHYLSALALQSAGTADDSFKTRGAALVAELAKCQRPNGYLSAFPEELFDRLREGRPAWAPFYTIHKIMAGLLDQYTLMGNQQALDVVQGMARWATGWMQPLGDNEMNRVLEREYGGMNEIFYNLAAATSNAAYRRTARRFDHERIFNPLALGRDELKGLHVNTNIPKIIGAARRYELTSEPRYRHIAEYFLREIIANRSYCTGGTSNGESWNADPGVLSTELGGYTQEDCTTYNMMKLTRHAFSWTAEAGLADYYERCLFNGILGVQHPSDGNKLYYVPLGSGYWKLFGTPTQDYWCCTGSMSEAFAKLGDSIYFQDEAGLFVNQFVGSELDWQEKRVTVTQTTNFPTEAGTTLTIKAAQPVRFALKVRVPYWANGGSAKLNGKALESFAGPSGYLVIDRMWKTGDTLAVSLPMGLHSHPMPDDPTVQAVMYGPLVLAAKQGTAGLSPANLRAEPTKPRTVPGYSDQGLPMPQIKATGDVSSWVSPVSGKSLEFKTVGQAAEMSLVPLNAVFDERYAVYLKVT